MTNKLQRLASTGLIVVGILILVLTGGLFAYGQYEQFLANRDVQSVLPPEAMSWTPVSGPPDPTATNVPPTFTPAHSAEPIGVPREGTTRQIILPTATPVPVPTATPIPITPIQRLMAMSIDLDTKVVESPIVNGEWTVPKFVAGHLVGTAQPLQGSNVVLSGHVQSISSGNVFARIGDLKLGDVILVYTKSAVISYVVSKTEVVANTDVAVVKPSPKEILTLITCTGTWLPLQRDYDSRIVVIASRQS